MKYGCDLISASVEGTKRVEGKGLPSAAFDYVKEMVPCMMANKVASSSPSPPGSRSMSPAKLDKNSVSPPPPSTTPGYAPAESRSDSDAPEESSVNNLSNQVSQLQKCLLNLQKASIVETLQHQIRMKMLINLAGGGTGGLEPGAPFNEELFASWRKNLEQSLLSLHQVNREGQEGPDDGQLRDKEDYESSRNSPDSLRDAKSAMSSLGEETGGTPRPGPIVSLAHRMSSSSHHQMSSSSPPVLEDSEMESEAGGLGTPPPPPPPHVSSGLSQLLPQSPFVVAAQQQQQRLAAAGVPAASSPATLASVMTTVGGGGGTPSTPHRPFYPSRIPKEDPLEERLHDMLRYNMEKFAGQPIDTLADSRRVREMLSVHNIGQRLFAKYVLGLSQGTVSELLSKPKSWDKLTEKGRDSYRKMHAWVWDDQAILLLKTLIPRKGELLKSSSAASLKQDLDDRHDERLNRILGEVNKSMDNVSGKPIFPGLDQRGGIQPGLFLPGLGCYPAIGSYPGLASPEDLQLAVSLYQAELAQHTNSLAAKMAASGQPAAKLDDKQADDSDRDSIKEEKENHEKDNNNLKLGPNSNPGIINNGLGHVADSPPHQPPPQPPTSPFLKLDAASLASLRVGGHAGGLQVDPRRAPQPHGPAGGGAFFDSPLQRMASITNSLVQSQHLPSQHFSPKPLKAALPPITQQQFDMFSHLNTDDIVRRTKEILSQYSISQRLFGEAVLGLSQGSVSDLLARPKPWHMLTQKGREPFIRMKLFLDDDSAIHKLVASQYKIMPDKLLRTGAYSSSHQMLPKPAPPQYPNLPGILNSQGRLPHPLLPGGMDRNVLVGLQQRHLLANSGITPPHLTPNLYEMAALTQELDTQAVTNRVKEILQANNMGQKFSLQLFGEAVLGLSQGSVSELLSKPKPWHMLSIKGREPFVRMQLWLNDPNNIDKLTAIKRLQEESRKRKYAAGSGFFNNNNSGSTNGETLGLAAADMGGSYSGRSSPSSLSDAAPPPIFAAAGGSLLPTDPFSLTIKRPRSEGKEDNSMTDARSDDGIGSEGEGNASASAGLDLSFRRETTEDSRESMSPSMMAATRPRSNDSNVSTDGSLLLPRPGLNSAAGGAPRRRKPIQPAQWATVCDTANAMEENDDDLSVRKEDDDFDDLSRDATEDKGDGDVGGGNKEDDGDADNLPQNLAKHQTVVVDDDNGQSPLDQRSELTDAKKATGDDPNLTINGVCVINASAI